jgi:hypothetical protein
METLLENIKKNLQFQNHMGYSNWVFELKQISNKRVARAVNKDKAMEKKKIRRIRLKNKRDDIKI